jgi:hypothetical protein
LADHSLAERNDGLIARCSRILAGENIDGIALGQQASRPAAVKVKRLLVPSSRDIRLDVL